MKRINIFSFFVLLITLNAFVFPSSVLAVVNELENGGMNQTFNYNGNPCVQVGWLPTPSSNLSSIDCEGPVSRSNGISLKTRGGAEVSQAITVSPFSNFSASVWVTTSSNGRGRMGVKLGSGSIVWQTSESTSWTQLLYTGNTGDNTSVTIYFRTEDRGLSAGVSDTYYDDANFVINNGATCESITPPGGGTVTSGQRYNVQTQFKNVGRSTWTIAGNYNMGSQDPQDNTNWVINSTPGSNRLPVPSSIAPGSIAIFNFQVTAPTVSTATNYNFNWQMVQEAVEWFGQKCTSQVTVNPSTPPTPTATPIPGQANLGQLNINADVSTSAITATPYGTSRLRQEDDPVLGRNVYNALIITQNVTGATAANVDLIATAFTNQSFTPANNSLSELVRGSNLNNIKGFVLLYANRARSAAGQSFQAGKYYIYFNGVWSSGRNLENIYGDSATGIRVRPTSNLQGKREYEAPTFSVTLFRSLIAQDTSRTWGNYSYLMRNNGVETILVRTPAP